MSYEVTKTYGHDLGLSCAFRQWRAESHCRFIHGYSLAFRFVFRAETLDAKGWVVDFGGLKALKARLVDLFDHKLAVAADDPMVEQLEALAKLGLAEVNTFPQGVGCEKFAQIAWNEASYLAIKMNRAEGKPGRVKVISAECMEHAGNSAIFIGDNS